MVKFLYKSRFSEYTDKNVVVNVYTRPIQGRVASR